MKTTIVFSKAITAFNQGARRIVSMGGTGASKSYSFLQLLLIIALKRQNTGVSISCVSETLPHLKLGIIRDFESILKYEGLYNEANINKTDHTYYFGKSYIEFFASDSGKATGPRRNILYLNECNNISYTIVQELEQRTDETILYDFNPTTDFWISEKVFMLPSSEYVLIKSNYLDNSELKPSIAKDIEYRASVDPNYKRVHIDVEFGMTLGLIFTNWRMCDRMPSSDRQSWGLDFGFTNDPSVLVNLRLNEGELWWNELLYQTGMTNPDIAEFIKGEELSRVQIIADSAEPKSIEELHRLGISIKGAVKGPDSVRHAIDAIKRYRINITKRSVNTIREFRSYKWKQDKDGNYLQQPVDYLNHSIDAGLYANQAFQVPVGRAKFSF